MFERDRMLIRILCRDGFRMPVVVRLSVRFVFYGAVMGLFALMLKAAL